MAAGIKESQTLQPETFGFFSGLVGKIQRGRLASRIRDPQQTDEVPNNFLVLFTIWLASRI